MRRRPTLARGSTRPGLVVGGIDEEHHASIGEGLVIAQEPAAGAWTVRAAKVRLTVSRGTATVSVPSLPGEALELDMVRIDEGGFQIGSPSRDTEADDDEKQHPVVIVKPFLLARYETTVSDFRRFVDTIGYVTDAERDVGQKKPISGTRKASRAP